MYNEEITTNVDGSTRTGFQIENYECRDTTSSIMCDFSDKAN